MSKALLATGEGNVNGFGLEFFIETPADELPSSLEDIKASWQFQLLYTVSQLAAGEEHLRLFLATETALPNYSSSQHTSANLVLAFQ